MGTEHKCQWCGKEFEPTCHKSRQKFRSAESAAVGGVFAATAAARSTIESRGRKSSMSRDEGNRPAPIAG